MNYIYKYAYKYAMFYEHAVLFKNNSKIYQNYSLYKLNNSEVIFVYFVIIMLLYI